MPLFSLWAFVAYYLYLNSHVLEEERVLPLVLNTFFDIFHFWLKSGKKTVHFARRPTCVSARISRGSGEIYFIRYEA